MTQFYASSVGHLGMIFPALKKGHEEGAFLFLILDAVV